jgi:hypothetical protein
MQRFFKAVKNTEIFQSVFVVMGDLPRWKIVKVVRNTKISPNGDIDLDVTFFVVVRNAMNSQNGFIVMGNRPKMEDEKSFQRGLIMMGDLPR